MPLLVPANLKSKQRIWFHRLITAKSSPTGKSTLCQFVSTIDRIVRLDNDVLEDAITLAAKCDGCSKDDVADALYAVVNGLLPGSSVATTATQVLEALIARIRYEGEASDRVRIAPSALQVLDFLNEWFRCQRFDRQQEQPGGAPAIVAEVLTQLEKRDNSESEVALWTFYHSKKQASVFDEKVQFLDIDDQCNFSAQPVRSTGRSNHPETQNYPMEFAKAAAFELRRSDGSICSVVAHRSDRAIAIAPGPRFFDPSSGRVDPSRVPPSMAPHILSADPWCDPSCAVQVAQAYKYWIIGGLHNVSDPVTQQSLEGDLQSIPSDVTVHVEIAGPKISCWFQHVLCSCVNSVGVNVDDLAGLIKSIVANEPDLGAPPAATSVPEMTREYHLRLALWLACALHMERVYVHGLDLDFVLRRQASDAEMNREVSGDLLAKRIVVINALKALSAGVDARPASSFGLSHSNLEAFIDMCALRAFPVDDWATLDTLPAFEPILDRGWFDDEFAFRGTAVPFRVAVVPVGLFRLDPPNLMFVGAGDTTSAVSFVFGCFTTEKTKRNP